MSVRPLLISFSPEMTHVIHEAFSWANARDEQPDSACLALFLVQDPRVVSALVAIGVNVEDVRDAILDKTEDSVDGSTPERASLQECLDRAAQRAGGAGFDSIHPTDAFVTLVDNSKLVGLEAIFADHPVDVLSLKWQLSHGQEARYSLRQRVHWKLAQLASKFSKRKGLDSKRRPSIVMHNDPFTTREFVVELLEDFFGMTEQRAQDAMLLIHRRGFAVVETPDSNAKEKMHAITKVARERGFPLRLSLSNELHLRARLPQARVL